MAYLLGHQPCTSIISSRPIIIYNSFTDYGMARPDQGGQSSVPMARSVRSWPTVCKSFEHTAHSNKNYCQHASWSYGYYHDFSLSHRSMFLQYLLSLRALLIIGFIQTSDAVKQSIPFSYVSIEAKSRDGLSHSVQVYCDISAGNVVHVSCRRVAANILGMKNGSPQTQTISSPSVQPLQEALHITKSNYRPMTVLQRHRT